MYVTVVKCDECGMTKEDTGPHLKDWFLRFQMMRTDSDTGDESTLLDRSHDFCGPACLSNFLLRWAEFSESTRRGLRPR